MNLQLKSIKTYPNLSRETICYEAVLYCDGRKIAHCTNDGNGGNDIIHPTSSKDKPLLDQIEVDMKKRYGFCQENLSMWISEQLTEFDFQKLLNKALKRVSYVKDGDLYQLPAKYKPTPEVLRAVKNANWWKSEYVMLNELSTDSAKILFKQIAQ